MFNKKITLLALWISALTLVGCSSTPKPTVPVKEAAKPTAEIAKEVAEPTPDNGTITDIVVATEGVSILKDIVVSLDLTDMLSSQWPYTVFAPTNEAFANLLKELDTTLKELSKDKELLKTIVQYHVLEGKVLAADVAKMKDGSSVKTVWGQEFVIYNQDGVKINDSNVISTDIMASNGIVHLLDKVLLPPSVIKMLSDNEESKKTIVARAMDSGNFPTLIAAVKAAWLVDMLSDEGPYTVFAPTEEAFAALLAKLDVTAEELLADTEMLKSVLAYHVLPGTYSAEDVMALEEATWFETAQWTDITINPNDGTPMINESMLVDTDMFTSNGVIHVIDQVLVPSS